MQHEDLFAKVVIEHPQHVCQLSGGTDANSDLNPSEHVRLNLIDGLYNSADDRNSVAF